MGYYFVPDLTKNTKSVTIQLSESGSIGFCQVPDSVRRIGIITSASTTRMSFDTVPASASTVLGGSALSDNFVMGVPLTGSPTVNWFNLDVGAPSRTLYFRGTGGNPQVTVICV